jgi:hypothetical protein
MNWKPFPICWKPVIREFRTADKSMNHFKEIMVGDVGLEPTTR